MQPTADETAADSASKRSRLVKEELLRGIDKFGKQLPVRLLAHALSYSNALDLARSQAVCGGWRLPLTFANRAWRVLYGQSWESESAEAADIAVGGADTPRVVRFKRRHQTEANWRAGRWRRTDIALSQLAALEPRCFSGRLSCSRS